MTGCVKSQLISVLIFLKFAKWKEGVDTSCLIKYQVHREDFVDRSNSWTFQVQSFIVFPGSSPAVNSRYGEITNYRLFQNLNFTQRRNKMKCEHFITRTMQVQKSNYRVLVKNEFAQNPFVSEESILLIVRHVLKPFEI